MVAKGKRLVLLGLLALVAVVGLLAARPQPPPAAPPRPELAVSFPILADIVGNVAGERFVIWSVVPNGADLHLYDAAPQDLVRLSRSAGFLYIGANNERFLESGGFRQIAREHNVPTFEYARSLTLITVDKVLDHGDHSHDLREGDPHVWLDPLQVVAMLDSTVAFLSRIDPAGEPDFRTNAARYRRALLDLHEEYLAGIAQIPEHRRKLIVFHDAYTYFAARYRFEVLAYVVKTQGLDPSARDLAELQDLIRAHNLPAVFKEPQFNSQILERLTEDRRTAVGLLLTDTFTEGVSTYLDLMRFNLASLTRHLKG